MKFAMNTNNFSASFLNFKKNLCKNLTFSVFGLKNRLKKRNKEIWLMGCAWILTHAPLLHNGFRAWE
jgi:hypothetical protein